MKNLKTNEKRSKNAVTLIWFVLVIDICLLISDYFQLELLKTGYRIPSEKATANEISQKIIGIAYLIASVISGFTFILWFRRAYFNLHTKINYLSHSEGWAALCWFVPFVNLSEPYKIMKELYQETDSLLSQKNETYTHKIKTTWLSWWWNLLIIYGAIGVYTFILSIEAVKIKLTIASMMGDIVMVPLALITIKLIKDYSTIEPLLFDLKEELQK